MFTIYTFLVDNEKVEEEDKLHKRWSWFKMIAIKPRRVEEEEEKKPEEKSNRSNLK